MKLYFTCPKEHVTFASDDYSLRQGHRIVEDDKGTKELQGTVSLNSKCPVCGRRHRYAVKDVLCPLNRGNNGQ